MEEKRYSAILYVHGMGQRARHEDVGSLIESLEVLADFQGPSASGELRRFKEGVEPLRGATGQDVSYTKFTFFTPKGEVWPFQRNFRAYEIYWSAITRRGQRPWTMLFWLLKQIRTSLRYWSTDWRLAYRLRVARLHRLREVTNIREHLAAAALSALREFQGPAGRRTYPNSDLNSLSSLASARAENQVSREAISKLIQQWSKSKTPAESSAAVLVWLSVGVSIASILWLGVCAIFSESELRSVLIGTHADVVRHLPDVLVTMAGLAITTLFSLVVMTFLSRTASDIRLWTSIRENDANYRLRRAIIDQAKETITHVVRDRHCARVIIIGHSLGSSIAYDALRELGQYNVARLEDHRDQLLELNKIGQLITLGSPIDKIAYFFEGKDSRHYRANRIRETIRGDLSIEPFFRDGKQQIEWINLWDDADVISDPLYSPLSSTQAGGKIVGARVTNFRIATRLFPNPYSAHSSYLKSQKALEIIFGAIFFSDPWRFVRSDETPTFLSALWQRWLRSTVKYSFSTLILTLGLLAVGLIFGWIWLIAVAVPFCVLAIIVLAICAAISVGYQHLRHKDLIF